MEENKPQTDNMNPAPAPAPAAPAPADGGGQMPSQAPASTGMPAAGGKPMMGKMGWVVAIVVLLLLLLGGLWWWMMYGQPTSTTNTTTTPNTSTNSSNNGTNGTNGSNGSNSTTTTKPIDTVATVKVGDTVTTVEGKAGSLSPLCVDSNGLEGGAAQKVCTYVDGTKSVKVTYQDNKVVEVTKLGF